ncbi:MAG: ketopantoate reductase family protein [Burkholderiaceae bacterium]
MRVAIIGAGAIGGAIGLRLAKAGHEVALVARGVHLAAMQARGATLVDHVHNETVTQHVCVTANARELPAQDLVVIGLKAHSIAAMLPQLSTCVGKDTVVLPAINGLPWWYFSRHGGAREGHVVRCLDPQGTMFSLLDTRHILGCVVHTAGEVRAPGEIHWTGGKRLIIGELDGTLSPRMTKVCDALDAAGFATERVTDIRKAVWTKLIGNLSFNPVAALTGYLMDEICADEAVLDVIRPMMAEAMQVAAAYDVQIEMTVEARINLARQLGAAKISMLQDLQAGRRLELEAIVGSVLELAQDAGIAIPITRHVHALISARARKLALV